MDKIISRFKVRIAFALVAFYYLAMANSIEADEVRDYIVSNPDVSIYALTVGDEADTCDTDCRTYDTVELSVPGYVLENIVEDFPAARNGIGDVSISTVSYEDELMKLVGDDTSVVPFHVGDTIEILYINNETGEVVASETASTTEVASAYNTTIVSNSEITKQTKKVEDPRQIQITKIKENLPGLNPGTIDVAINILKEEFQNLGSQNVSDIKSNVEKKINLIDNLLSSGELTSYDVEKRYPRIKFFSQLNQVKKQSLTKDELVFLKEVNKDLTNLSSSIMRKNPEILVKGLYKKLLKDIRDISLKKRNNFMGKKKELELDFPDYVFVADMMRNEFDQIFANFLNVGNSSLKEDLQYNPRSIDPDFLNEKLRLQEEVILYLGLFRKEIFEKESFMVAFSDEIGSEINLSVKELKERFLAENLIKNLISAAERSRPRPLESAGQNSILEGNIKNVELVRKVNFILDESVNDMLSILEKNVDGNRGSLWKNLSDFLMLSDNADYIEPNVAINSNGLYDGGTDMSEMIDLVIDKREEIQDLAAIAAVMGYPVLGPP